jgi:predicted metal-dependent enzyme (double-stranded beta helix superfamily)
VFDLDTLIEDCRRANREAEPRRAVREVLARVVRDPGPVADTLRPTEGGLHVLHNAPDLTVLNIVWAPGMELYPHDHRMWAAIAIYTGTEENAFYRRSGPDRHGLTESGGKVVETGDVLVLGDDAIHSVTNPTDRLTGAIHVYGGDFVGEPRSQWGPGPREERPFSMDDLRAQFAEANATWAARERA